MEYKEFCIKYPDIICFFVNRNSKLSEKIDRNLGFFVPYEVETLMQRGYQPVLSKMRIDMAVSLYKNYSAEFPNYKNIIEDLNNTNAVIV